MRAQRELATIVALNEFTRVHGYDFTRKLTQCAHVNQITVKTVNRGSTCLVLTDPLDINAGGGGDVGGDGGGDGVTVHDATVAPRRGSMSPPGEVVPVGHGEQPPNAAFEFEPTFPSSGEP